MASSNDHAERQPSRKAMLHCPDCNHESRINGDWTLQVHPTHLDYECPECGNVIESRPGSTDVIPPA